MLPEEVRADLYESKPIRNMPLGIQDDLIMTFEEVFMRHYTAIVKESDSDVSDTVQSVPTVQSVW